MNNHRKIKLTELIPERIPVCHKKKKKKKNTFKKILSKSILDKYTCYSTVKHMVLHLTQHFWEEF